VEKSNLSNLKNIRPADAKAQGEPLMWVKRVQRLT
jgi:hypothetical protein